MDIQVGYVKDDGRGIHQPYGWYANIKDGKWENYLYVDGTVRCGAWPNRSELIPNKRTGVLGYHLTLNSLYEVIKKKFKKFRIIIESEQEAE